MSAWVKYTNSLQKRPILTKAATSGALNALQEMIAATITKTADAHSISKAIKMSAYGIFISYSGFFVSGPLGHFLYLKLDRIIAKRTGKAAALLKLLIANLCISPILIGLYLVALARISGLSLKRSVTVARNRLLATLKISWILNPLVQLYAFQVILN
jgi:hypothetical protein